jgi:phage-related protein (TIGR01555 family)
MQNRHARRAAAAQARDAAPPTAKNQTTDGFQNLVLRVGEGSTVMQGGYVRSGLTRNYVALDAMYRGSWIVGQAVDAVAEDMTRAGISLMGLEPEKAAEMQRKMTRMGLWNGITQNIKWGRLYGGSIGVIMIDGQDLQSPLRPKTIRKDQFSGIKIFDRWSASPNLTYKVMEGMQMGLPEYYNITRLGLTVHHTRCIRQIGIDLPWNEAEREEMWGCSIVERLYDRLLPFDTATTGAAQLLSRAHLRTVSIEGLRQILAQGGIAEENLIKMFALMRTLQSNEGITLLDKEDEFEAHSYTFSGIEGLITQFAQQISGATGIPLVRLLGQSPAGMNSTGESDMRMYYDNIAQQQESRLRYGLQRLLDVLHWSMYESAPEDDFDFSFNPLKQLDPKEKAETAERMTKAITEAYGEDLIDRPTAMMELQRVAEICGIFGNVSPEMILEAKEMVKQAKENPLDPNGLDPLTGLPKPPPPVLPGEDPAKPGEKKPAVKANGKEATE